MIDARETARRAILRAEEIQEARRRVRIMTPIVISGICAAFVALYVTAFPFSKPPENQIYIGDMPVPLAAPLTPDNDAVPYNGAGAETESIIKIPSYDAAVMTTGSPDAKVALYNPEGNTCWFTFEITLADTGETLYTSGMVAPSMCLENITLNKTLNEGEHTAYVTIREYDVETLEKTGQVSVTTTLIVGK